MNHLIYRSCGTFQKVAVRFVSRNFSRTFEKLTLTAVLSRSSGRIFGKAATSILINKQSVASMPPIGSRDDLKAVIDEYLTSNKVVVFSKTTCPYCKKVKNFFNSLAVQFLAVELDAMENGAELQQALAEFSGQRTVPNVFVEGKHIGGSDDVLKAHQENRLFTSHGGAAGDSYDYDLIVIGGGSGGLSAAKEAADLGMKVACVDFVKPSPRGTSWGLGGTCVNVGCIPKKLMHQTALLGQSLEDARKFGWEFSEAVQHNWVSMKTAVQDHIGSLNWGYKVQLRNKNVTYLNSYAQFIGPHKISAVNKKGVTEEYSGRYFVIATGGRPKYPDIPGCAEYCISSDDLFSLAYPPGKSLVIGASYVSLECAGFLKALGFDTTVMVRSILLRGFDQQMAELIGDYMTKEGISFIRPCVPSKIEKISDGEPGLYRVTAVMQDSGQEVVGEYNTVMVAVGRDPCTSELGLDTVGVKTNPKTGYVICEDDERTSCPYVYAIGDIIEGEKELTPLAIQAGKLLARRLFAGSDIKCDYVNVPTTVFTPLEYGNVGLSEEAAIARYGNDDIQVYHAHFQPLEWTVPHRPDNACYGKLICVISQNERVVGLHILGPNAGEITQGWTVAIKLNATKSDFDNSIGIHPTCAELFTTMDITKRSGKSAQKTGC